MKFYDRAFCINLEDRKDRWDLAQKEFNKLGLDVDRFNAFRDKENPANGCHISHAGVLMTAKTMNLNNVLVFEDDVEFFPNAKENLEQSIIELPPDWDMLYLGINMDQFYADQVSDHIAKLNGGFSTHAILIRNTLFDKLIEINTASYCVHNDIEYSFKIHPYYNCYVTIPLVAGQRSGYSDIQGKVMESNPMFIERLNQRLRKK